MNIRLSEKLNSYMVMNEAEVPVRIATKDDWYKIVECTHIHVMFGVPLCGFNIQGVDACPICLKNNTTIKECPMRYKRGRKIISTEDI